MKEVACLATSIGMFISSMFSDILNVGRGQPCPDEVWYLLEGNGKETSMSKSSPSISRNVHHAERGARNAATGPWMAALARCGYAAKGVVYLIIGWIAAKVAIGAGGAVTDLKGALQTILEQPFGLGRILFGVVTIGLFGFVL